MTLLHTTWGSACGQPRVQQMCYLFAIRAGMEEIFSADLVGAQGSALAHASYVPAHFVGEIKASYAELLLVASEPV